MTGTYSRHKTNKTGLKPLEDRMTDKQFERRTAKIAMRVGREAAITRGMTQTLYNAFFGRSFLGRMKFIFLGR